MQFDSSEQLAAYLLGYPGLEVLEIENSPELKELPELPDTLKYLFIRNCPNLRKLSLLPLTLCCLSVTNCPGLTEVAVIFDGLIESGREYCHVYGIEIPNLSRPGQLDNLLVIWSKGSS